jgi:hypothetical protein
MLALGNPLRFIHLHTGEITAIEGDYGGYSMTFSADGTAFFINSAKDYYQSKQSIMVFGIRTDERPAWQPVSTRIHVSAINVRSEHEGNSPVIGTASGEVIVLARDESGEAVYLAEPAGWVWSAPEYINLDENELDVLPVRSD